MVRRFSEDRGWPLDAYVKNRLFLESWGKHMYSTERLLAEMIARFLQVLECLRNFNKLNVESLGSSRLSYITSQHARQCY